MYNEFLLFFIFLLLLISSITDILRREVSNRVLFFFFMFGIFFKLFCSFYLNDFSILGYTFLLFVISFVFFYFVWSFGVIAGGDLKLFLVIAMLAPKVILPFNISFYLFTIVLFVISVFMIFPWFFISSFYFVFKNNYFKDIFKKVFCKDNLLSLFGSFLFVLLLSFGFSIFSDFVSVYVLLFSFVFSFFMFRLNKKFYYFVLGVLYIVALFFFFKLKAVYNFTYVFEIILCLFIFSFLKQAYVIIKTKILIETKSISKLKEGDLLVYNYYFTNNKIKLISPTFFTKLKMLINNTYYKDLKIDSSLACGVLAKDIAFLKSLYKNNLIKDKVFLKKTMAFVPSVFLGFILLVLVLML